MLFVLDRKQKFKLCESSLPHFATKSHDRCLSNTQLAGQVTEKVLFDPIFSMIEDESRNYRFCFGEGR